MKNVKQSLINIADCLKPLAPKPYAEDGFLLLRTQVCCRTVTAKKRNMPRCPVFGISGSDFT